MTMFDVHVTNYVRIPMSGIVEEVSGKEGSFALQFHDV
jgi:hypothetical protein